MTIYTRKGDHGQTRLGDGTLVGKDEQRLECLGDVDELSACIGLAIALLRNPGRVGSRPALPAAHHRARPSEASGEAGQVGGRRVWEPSQGSHFKAAAGLVAQLSRVQNELSALCADLATPSASKRRIAARHVTALERRIDAWSARLPPLRAFILPGGGPAAACLHLARTICRRTERQVVRLAAQEPVANPILAYLNRLSDALFVAARTAAHLCGQGETPATRPRPPLLSHVGESKVHVQIGHQVGHAHKRAGTRHQ